MRRINLLIIISISVSTFFSCNRTTELVDVLESNIDTSVSPGDDFFQYANGKWFNSHPIPADESYNGIYLQVDDTINSQIRNICETSSKGTFQKGSARQKIGDMFLSGMDSLELNKQGITPIEPLLKRTKDIDNIKSLSSEAAYMQRIGSYPLFFFYVSQDNKNSSKYSAFLWQGGISLPDREYYVATDNRTKEILIKFKEHLFNSFKILKYNNLQAKKAADDVFSIQTYLAKASRKIEDLRDPIANYNALCYNDLKKLTPSFNWDLFFAELNLKNIDTVIVGQPEFLKSLNQALNIYSIEQWKNYFNYTLFSYFGSYLNDNSYNETFSFYYKVIDGVQQPKPRWKRVVTLTNDLLGDLVGEVYVKEYLPKNAKEKLIEMGENIRTVFAKRIRNLDWMSDSTKSRALKKLNSVTMKMGYPDKWKDMSALEIDKTSFLNNVINAKKWQFNYMLGKLGKPVDRSEWMMQPQTYNAYYKSTNNEIVIPGCILTIPGFEHKLADDAILYGAIAGATIAHELTHGFDDKGRKYDEYGNLKDWWSPEDVIKFKSKAKLIVEQFNNYIPVDSLHINGLSTQGENIADLGGVIMGFEAFKMTDFYKNKEMVGSMTPAQRYFTAYAMSWLEGKRPELLARQLRSDVHSPAKYRVNGPLSNIPEFYQAFNVLPGNKMWRPDSMVVRIW